MAGRDREGERQRILEACMAVVQKEDKNEARDRDRDRDKNDRNRNVESTTDEGTFSRSSTVSTPSSTTTSLSKLLAPIIERRNSLKPQETTEGKTSVLAQKQLRQRVKAVKSETSISASDEVSTVSYTRSFVPESLQPISELSDGVTEVGSMEEVPELSNKSFESSKLTSVNTTSLKSKSSRKAAASVDSASLLTSRSGSVALKRSPASTSVSKGSSRNRSKTSDLSSKQVTSSLIKSQKLTLQSLDEYPVVEILPPRPRRKQTSSTSSSSSQIGSFKNIRKSSRANSESQDLTKSSQTSQPTASNTYADSFLSWKTSNEISIKDNVSASGPSNRTEASKSRSNRSQGFDECVVEDVSRASFQSQNTQHMSLRDIVMAEQRRILKNHAGPLPGSDPLPKPKRSMDGNEQFMSDLDSELTSIQENFQVVTESKEEPKSYSDDFLPETFTSRKKEKPAPKYPVSVPDLELPPFKPAPTLSYPPGLQFDAERWKERQKETYYGQPYYEPSGNIVDVDSLPPATKFVNSLLNSNSRMFYAAIKAAHELGEFNLPRFQGKGMGKKTRPAPTRPLPPRPDTVPHFPSFHESDVPGRGPISRARFQFEQRRQEAEAEREWFKLLAEHRRREREEQATPADLDIDSLFHEHKRLIKDKERRRRERDRLNRERERREYDRMQEDRRRREKGKTVQENPLRRRAKSSKR